MSIVKTSIGKKLVMSISGMFLIFFLSFHLSMNIVVLFSPSTYNRVCEFLGSNWYAVLGSSLLALGFLVHIGYAFLLSFQNARARGGISYKVPAKPKGLLSFASRNMLVLGAIIAFGLITHLYQFWYKMQFAEFVAARHEFAPTDGASFVKLYFSNIYLVILYLAWFVTIWLHLTHGFWSMFQTMGLSNTKLTNRLKTTSIIYSTLICGGFAAIVIITYVKSLLE